MRQAWQSPLELALDGGLANIIVADDLVAALISSPESWQERAAEVYTPVAMNLAAIASAGEGDYKHIAYYLARLNETVPIPEGVACVFKAVIEVGESRPVSWQMAKLLKSLPSSANAEQEQKAKEALDELIAGLASDYLSFPNTALAGSIEILGGARVRLFGKSPGTLAQLSELIETALYKENYGLAMTAAKAYGRENHDLTVANQAVKRLQNSREGVLEDFYNRRKDARQTAWSLEEIAGHLKKIDKIFGLKFSYTLRKEIQTVARRITERFDERFKNGTVRRMGLQYLAELLACYAEIWKGHDVRNHISSYLGRLERVIKNERIYLDAVLDHDICHRPK